MNIKINLHQIIFIAFAIIFCVPEYLVGIPVIGFLCKMIRYGYLTLMLIDLLMHGKVNSKITIWLTLYYIFIAISTYMQSGLDMSLFRSLTKSSLVTILIINYFAVNFKNNGLLFLKWMAILGEIVAVTNLIIILMFPDGLFKAMLTGEPSFLLGHKNSLLTYLIIPVFASIVYFGVKNGNKIAKRSFSLLIVILISSFLSNASTVVLCTLLLIILLYCLKFKKLKKLMTMRNAVIAGIGLNVMICIFRIQNLFSFIIVDIFNKNLTFSSRTQIWDLALSYFDQNKLFGVGHEFLWTIVHQIMLSSAHNMIIGILFHLGLIGIVMWAIAFIIITLQGKNNNGKFCTCVCAIVLFVFLIQGITEEITTPFQEMPILLIMLFSYLLPTYHEDSSFYVQINSKNNK